mgnify:CR=1 FL=1
MLRGYKDTLQVLDKPAFWGSPAHSPQDSLQKPPFTMYPVLHLPKAACCAQEYLLSGGMSLHCPAQHAQQRRLMVKRTLVLIHKEGGCPRFVHG